METRVISLTADFEAGIALGASLLASGCLVAFPTETVYGLGANALDARAVARIFNAKGRPGDNPLIAHVAGIEDVYPLVLEVPPLARSLMEHFWPGPLTIVLPKSERVPGVVSAGLSTVAVRMPKHNAALALIRASGVPVAAPSANLSGRPSPTSAKHVLADLNGRVELILDGGETTYGVESTVARLTPNGVEVLRPGGVTVEMLRLVADDVLVHPAVLAPLNPASEAVSPGMLHRHYAPRARVLVVEGDDEQRAEAICGRYENDSGKKRIFCMEETRRFYQGKAYVIMGNRQDAGGMCARLFSLLREMDEQNVDIIYIEGATPSGMGLALMNRMLRASGFNRVSAGQAGEGPI